MSLIVSQVNQADQIVYSGIMCPLRMYDPAKPIKHGIWLYWANDSLTGYCCGLEPHEGSGHRITIETNWNFENLNFRERPNLYFKSQCPACTSFFSDRFHTTACVIELEFGRHSCFWTGTLMANNQGNALDIPL